MCLLTLALPILPQQAVKKPFDITAYEWKELWLNEAWHQPLIWLGSACMPLNKIPEISFHSMQKRSPPPSSQTSISNKTPSSLKLAAAWIILGTVIIEIYKLKAPSVAFLSGMWGFGCGPLKFCSAYCLCSHVPLYILVQESAGWIVNWVNLLI